MTSALMPSRRNMCAKAFITVVVPAPDDPVTAMTDVGLTWCDAPDQARASGRNSERSLNSGEVIGAVGAAVELGMIALDALDFVARSEDHRNALMQ